jgi:hypothetical protein
MHLTAPMHPFSPMTPVADMTEQQAADHLRVSLRTLQRWRSSKIGPTFSRLGPRWIRYSLADLEAWRASGRCDAA